MFKKYQAGSDLAFSVSVSGEPKRIVFNGQCRGTSIYTTRDAAEQEAIERHYWYGDKFKCTECVDEAKLAAEQKKKKLAAEQKKEKTVRSFSDIAEAKEYIADKYGISRTKMRTKSDILDIAKAKGIDINIEE